MKISRHWLQKYFEEELPSTEKLADALTFHAFEIDGIEKVGDDEVLDVKVTPNRGHDCLSHRGIALELSAILGIRLANDPLKEAPNLSTKAAEIVVLIEETVPCPRYITGYIRGVVVAPSPKWLAERLEAIGQRSINNVVDATNFVMFNLGQPLHAFDADKLVQKGGTYAIKVRAARAGEKLIALDGKEYALAESMLVIADANKNEAIGIAGVKGGMPAGITKDTKDIIIESANFDGPSVRKTAQMLKLRTDASARFEQIISPELAAYGMRSVVDLILKLAGGEVAGFTDVYPVPQKQRYASVTVEKINETLGVMLTGADVSNVFQRLGFSYKEETGVFQVSVPFERLDIEIPEDLVEEVGRIIGYDKVPAIELPPFPQKPEINKNFYTAEKIREKLISEGYSEIFTSVFAERGERLVLNKVDGVKPYLRDSLLSGLRDALERNVRNKELLGLKEVKLFEIGTIWKGGVETMMFGKISEKEKPSEEPLKVGKVPLEYENLALSQTERYQPFSKFPYIVRDVSVWVGLSEAQQVASAIREALIGSESLVREVREVDVYKKGEKISITTRIIFQSFDQTLTDEEANVPTERIYAGLKKRGFEIR